MHALALDILGRFHDGFGEGRVGVDRVHQLIDRGLQLDGDAGFVDQVGGVRADDVDAQNLAVLVAAYAISNCLKLYQSYLLNGLSG